MQFVCDAPGGTWFRFETEGEAIQESQLMQHAVEKYYRQFADEAARTFVPPATMRPFEQKIGLKAHVHRTMPMFLTLRDNEGKGLATAMLPPGGKESRSFRPIIVGPGNSDPYPKHSAAIAALGRHFGLVLDAARCLPSWVTKSSQR